MAGENPTVGDGFREAMARLPQIAGWALLSATVGLVLRIIEDRSKWVGRVVAGLLGMAWTVTSFMVVPIIVAERKGPFAALKGSTQVLRKTWGEQLVGSFSFGAVFGLLSLPALAMIVIAIILGNTVMIMLSIALAVGYLIVLSLIQSALQSIFQAAVYLYAYNHGMAPEGFDPDLLAGAMQAK
jgi:cytochrome c biogenesis protein CcdA